jgi:hypothetical protein
LQADAVRHRRAEFEASLTDIRQRAKQEGRSITSAELARLGDITTAVYEAMDAEKAGSEHGTAHGLRWPLCWACKANTSHHCICSGTAWL